MPTAFTRLIYCVETRLSLVVNMTSSMPAATLRSVCGAFRMASFAEAMRFSSSTLRRALRVASVSCTLRYCGELAISPLRMEAMVISFSAFVWTRFSFGSFRSQRARATVSNSATDFGLA